MQNLYNFSELLYCLHFFKRFYLFIHEKQRERVRDTDIGRGRSRLHAGSLTWDSILGLQDHALGQGGTKPLSPPGLPPCAAYGLVS